MKFEQNDMWKKFMIRRQKRILKKYINMIINNKILIIEQIINFNVIYDNNMNNNII